MAKEQGQESFPNSEDVLKVAAVKELSELFKELGYTNIGETDQEGREITPFLIVTELRDKNPDIKFTRDQALTELLVFHQVSIPRAIRIGELWGEAYGTSRFGETMERIIDRHNFSPEQKEIVEEMVLGTASVLIEGFTKLHDLPKNRSEA